MNLEALKQQIIALVNASQDEAMLNNVLDILSIDKVETNTNDMDLTLLCMTISEKSLAEAWDKEDDEYWNSF